jgi:hypothetical protein
MTIKMRMPSPSDHRFAPDAFDNQIGTLMLVTLPGAPPESVYRKLLSATVHDGGVFADLELDGDDFEEPVRPGAFSIGTPRPRDLTE